MGAIINAPLSFSSKITPVRLGETLQDYMYKPVGAWSGCGRRKQARTKV